MTTDEQKKLCDAMQEAFALTYDEAMAIVYAIKDRQAPYLESAVKTILYPEQR